MIARSGSINSSRVIKTLLMAILAALPSAPSWAINFDSFMGKKSGIAEPSEEPPPLPDMPVNAAPVKRSSIPPLPLSDICKQSDMEGLWRLQQVYEEPAGNASAAFNLNPIQYMYYKPNGIYGKYNGDGGLATPELIIEHIDEHATGLQQYLLQNTGLIYFYQDKIANDTQTCFIVLKKQPPFMPGDMLLIPPKGQIAGRLIKQFSKVPMTTTPPSTSTPTPQNAPINPLINPSLINNP